MGAYLFAEGAPDENGNSPPPPRELVDLSYIDRFGVMAVYGRDVLSYNEIQRLMVVENMINAYSSRKASDNWGAWAISNPQSAALLIEVEKTLDAD